MVDTERSYLGSLEQLLRHFRPTLQPLAPSLVRAVFDELGLIYNVSEELLGRLEPIPEVITTAADPSEPALLSWAASALAAAFTPHAALSGAAPHPLRAYRPFVNHYDDTASKLAELAKVPTFDARAKAVAASLGISHTLADMLIMPIQRPPRYLMLLERALAILRAAVAADAAGWASLDAPLAPLEAAVATVREVVRDLNECKRETDTLLEVSRVQRRLRGTMTIEHPCRRFVAEGELLRLMRGGEWQPRRAILFNDMLLICRQEAEADVEDTLCCEQVVQLHRTRVLDNTTPDGARAQLIAVSSLFGSDAAAAPPGSRAGRLRDALARRAEGVRRAARPSFVADAVLRRLPLGGLRP